MKLEIGMYVRTIKGKIWIINSQQAISGHRKDIINASNNIIDLIEVGDVIVDKEGHKYPINYEFETDYNTEYQSYEITIDDRITLFFKDGLSIITHEQIESMQYKVD